VVQVILQRISRIRGSQHNGHHLGIVPRKKDVKVLDLLTTNEYKTKDGVLDRSKTRLCIRGHDQ
jgi:hypothetical protein